MLADRGPEGGPAPSETSGAADSSSSSPRAQNKKIPPPPFFEPGLERALKQNSSNIRWAQNRQEAADSELVFFTLSAPVLKNGDLNMRGVFEWARLIAQRAALKPGQPKTLIIKSSFPIGTNRRIQQIAQGLKAPLNVASCPEFLRAGSAIQDITRPARAVIGSRTPEAGRRAEAVFRRFAKGARIIHASPETAELSKLASNAFLSMKISFAGEISLISEACGGNMQKLSEILSADPRIAAGGLEPGLGFGGPCLPKDLQLLIFQGESLLKNREPAKTARERSAMRVLRAAQAANSWRPEHVFLQIRQRLGILPGKALAFWGLSFKSGSDGLSHSPALALARRLLRAGAELHIADPFLTEKGMGALLSKKERAKARFCGGYGESPAKKPGKSSSQKAFHSSLTKSLDGKDGLIIAAAGEAFSAISLKEIKKRLKTP